MFDSLSGKATKRMLAASVLPFALLAASAHAQNSSQWGSGKNLYDKICRHCHDPQVGVGPVIAGRDLPESYIRYIVRNGFNAMPAFPASYIDDQSIAQVADYLSTLPAPASRP